MTILVEKPSLFLVSRRGDILKKYGDNLQIKNKDTGEIRQKIPALGIRDIIVFGDISIDAGIMLLLEKYSIPIHFLTNGGKFKASLVFNFSKNIFLRNRQFETSLDKSIKYSIARDFLLAKVHNQNTVLQKFRVKSRLRHEIPEDGLTLDQLRGTEGYSARKYFSIWQTENLIKNKDFKFIGRNKRPALDEINTLLSFGYSLLHSEIHTQLMICGLDPYIGYLHEPSFGHAALASDFIEIFRGPVEHFLIKSINRKEFNIDKDFNKNLKENIKLSSNGFQKFFQKWITFSRIESFENNKTLIQVIEKDIRKFTHYLMRDSHEFIPYHWKK